MFRTAEAGGIGHLYLAGITGTPENRMIHKAALGAEDIVEWSHDRSVADILTSLKQSGYTIAALEQTDSPTAISEFGGDAFPLALVVGNEVTGVSESALELCDVAVEIEQFGAKHSLNVAVAFGICLFRIVDRFRQVREVPFHPTVPTHP